MPHYYRELNFAYIHKPLQNELYIHSDYTDITFLVKEINKFPDKLEREQFICVKSGNKYYSINRITYSQIDKQLFQEFKKFYPENYAYIGIPIIVLIVIFGYYNYHLNNILIDMEKCSYEYDYIMDLYGKVQIKNNSYDFQVSFPNNIDKEDITDDEGCFTVFYDDRIRVIAITLSTRGECFINTNTDIKDYTNIQFFSDFDEQMCSIICGGLMVDL